MPYEARIEADSISGNNRITTFVITYPRFILAELNTHRMLSRSTRSSRAIPVEKHIELLENDMFIPEFGSNKRGMQAGELLPSHAQEDCKREWKSAFQIAQSHAKSLCRYGVHKQWANRLLEPFSWATTIVTATNWENFFKLRCHPDAQPEFQKIAYMMKELYDSNTPEKRIIHAPFYKESLENDIAKYLEDHPSAPFDTYTAKCCTAKCARVSYNNHDGTHSVEKDLELYQRLIDGGHMSPLEHVAYSVVGDNNYYANFKGWKSHRFIVEGEDAKL